MPYQVVVRHWHENAVGEQGDGPEVPAGTFATHAEAAAEAERLSVVRMETQLGGAYGTWVRIREVADQ